MKNSDPQDFMLRLRSASTSNKVEELIPKTKLIEILKGFLEKPDEDIPLSEIEAALQPFWESHPAEIPRSVTFNPEAMNQLAELIKEYKERNNTSSSG